VRPVAVGFIKAVQHRRENGDADHPPESAYECPRVDLVLGPRVDELVELLDVRGA